jgi:hypothetical protein
MCKVSLKNALLLSTAVLAVMTITSPLAIRPAAAACSNASPATGETVTCSGTDTTGVYAGSGVTGVTVNILDLAEVNTSGMAILVRDDSSSISTARGKSARRATVRLALMFWAATARSC